MSFFTHNLIHTITYARQGASADSNGDATFGAQSSAACKVIGKVQRVTSTEGDEREAHHVVYTEAEIRVGDRIWLAALGDDVANASHARRPIHVTRSPALKGNATLYAVIL